MNSLFFVSCSKWPLSIVCVHLVLDMKVLATLVVLEPVVPFDIEQQDM